MSSRLLITKPQQRQGAELQTPQAGSARNIRLPETTVDTDNIHIVFPPLPSCNTSVSDLVQVGKTPHEKQSYDFIFSLV